MAWVNGKGISRFWNNYLSPLMQPTQSEYHVPRSYIKPGENLLVVLAEDGRTPQNIEILTVNRDMNCSSISESHPVTVGSWDRNNNKLRPVVDSVNPAAHLKCPNGKNIVAIEFASFGDPGGAFGNFSHGKCTSPATKSVVEKQCLGKVTCMVPMSQFDKKGEVCPDIMKTLAIQAKCSF